MGWCSPLVNYCTRRLDEQRSGFDGVRREISSVVEAVDLIVESYQMDDSDSRRIAIRELHRLLDDLHWSSWNTLGVVSRRGDRKAVAKSRGELETSLQSLRESSESMERRLAGTELTASEYSIGTGPASVRE
jgi:hypothetical protein